MVYPKKNRQDLAVHYGLLNLSKKRDLFSGSGICSIVARDNRVNSIGAEINTKRQKEIENKLSEPVQMNIFDFLH